MRSVRFRNAGRSGQRTARECIIRIAAYGISHVIIDHLTTVFALAVRSSGLFSESRVQIRNDLAPSTRLSLYGCVLELELLREFGSFDRSRNIRPVIDKEGPAGFVSTGVNLGKLAAIFGHIGDSCKPSAEIRGGPCPIPRLAFKSLVPLLDLYGAFPWRCGIVATCRSRFESVAGRHGITLRIENAAGDRGFVGLGMGHILVLPVSAVPVDTESSETDRRRVRPSDRFLDGPGVTAVHGFTDNVRDPQTQRHDRGLGPGIRDIGAGNRLIEKIPERVQYVQERVPFTQFGSDLAAADALLPVIAGAVRIRRVDRDRMRDVPVQG